MKITLFSSRLCFSLYLCFLLSFNPYTASAAEDDFFDMPLENLMDIEVTSVSKRAEKVSEAAAAVFVITNEDLRRGGFTNVPEALRIVPGLQVARIDSGKWAITSRGFNRQFSNKLLVMIDGRTVYTPIFSGVWWDAQDVLLEDVDRIEVIRGPGATLWGANAFNGVINIITKHTKDTQGSLASVGAGYHENFIGAYRHGDRLENGNGHYRVYAKRNDRDEFQTTSGTEANDDWYRTQGGFRIDFDKDKENKYTLQGDAYSESANIEFNTPSLTFPFSSVVGIDGDIRGMNLLGKWTHKTSGDGEVILQSYFDYFGQDVFVFDQQTMTYDLDFQHSFAVGSRNEITWGMGYRYIKDNLNDTEFLDYAPDSDSYDLISGFVQDKITLLPEKWFLTLGTKLEHNDYTGFEVQPSARTSWLINDQHMLWSAVSRAVRTPSRGENSLSLLVSGFPAGALGAGTPAGFITQSGHRDFESETLVAYETGYRFTPSDQVSVDVTAFYNDYENLRSNELGMPGPALSPMFGPYLNVPLVLDNKGHGNSYGFEVASSWQVTDYWKLAAAYTFLNLDLGVDADSSDTLLAGEEGNSPHNQFNIRSLLNLPNNIEWDNTLFYVDNLTTPGVEDYIRVDTRLGWKPVESVDLSLVGTNLFDNWHQEFSPALYGSNVEIGRSIFGKVTFRY